MGAQSPSPSCCPAVGGSGCACHLHARTLPALTGLGRWMGGHRDPHSATMRPPSSPGSWWARAPAVLGSLAGLMSDQGRLSPGQGAGQAAGSRAVLLWVCLICPIPPPPTSHCPPPLCLEETPGLQMLCPLVCVGPSSSRQQRAVSECLFVQSGLGECLWAPLPPTRPPGPWACLPTPPGPLLSAGCAQTRGCCGQETPVLA